MNRTIWQPRLSIFFLCAGIVVSLAQGSFPHGAASHERKTTRGMAGSPEQVPALDATGLLRQRPAHLSGICGSCTHLRYRPSKRAVRARYLQ